MSDLIAVSDEELIGLYRSTHKTYLGLLTDLECLLHSLGHHQKNLKKYVSELQAREIELDEET